MEINSDYLIIGAGIAGLTAATTIRSLDKAATITLINGEYHSPYKRTALSKYLASGFAPGDFTLATKEDLQKSYNIHLLEDIIKQIDYEQKLAIAGHCQYGYRYLILATGAKYELPAGLQHPKIKFYHNKQETLALQEQLKGLPNIAILGGGVQGIETCYELLKLSKNICLIDPHETPLARFSFPYISAYLKQDLEDRGVQCHWNQRICNYTDSILNEFELTVCCFGTIPVTELFPKDALLQDNLLIAPGVFVCGDNLVYSGPNADLNTNRCTLWHEAMDLGQLAGQNAVRLAQGTAIENLTKMNRKVYRTKIGIIDKILFLGAPIFLAGKDNLYSEKHFLLSNSDYYQLIIDQQDKLIGASLLCENRDLLQPLQQAIWENLEYGQACSILDIPQSSEFDGLFPNSK